MSKISDLNKKLQYLQKTFRFYQKKQELLRVELRDHIVDEFYFDIFEDHKKTRDILRNLMFRIRKLRKMIKGAQKNQ